MPTPAGHLNGATLLGRSVLCFGLPSRQFVRVRMNRIEARIGRCSMAVRLEHANLTVRDIDAMIRFLQTAFPEFKVRGEGKNRDGGRWVHVGTDQTYIALSPAKREPEQHWMPKQGGRDYTSDFGVTGEMAIYRQLSCNSLFLAFNVRRSPLPLVLPARAPAKRLR